MQHNTDNVRIISSAPMVSPNTLIDKLPLSEKAASVVVSSRNAIKNILYGNDNRLMVLVCLLYTSPSPRDATLSRMPSSA